MNGMKSAAAALCLGLGLGFNCTAAADALSTLNDPEAFKQAQKDLAEFQRPELDALIQVVAPCSAASIGQRIQLFECEKQITIFWAHYNRGRAIDSYLTAFSGLLVGFDNNPLNPTPDMMQTYRHATNDLLTLTKGINARYRQIEK
jgi:hypothetical protein